MKNFLFNLFHKTTTGKKEHYFGLILKEEEGLGMLLEIDQDQKKIKKIDEKKFVYSNSWEQIIEDVDEILYELENTNKTRVEKVIFFLYSHLVDQKSKEIKKPYLDKIKNLAKKLELKPLGFIEHHEALSLYLNQKEEAPLTSVIVELDKSSVSLFMYKGGALIFCDSIAKTEDLIIDLETIFNKTKGEIILPSRIIIFNSGELEDESNKIINHLWKEDLFIQIPRVEVLNYEELKEALLFSFSQQVFKEGKPNIIEKKKQEEKDVLGFMIGKDIREAVKDQFTEDKIVGPNFVLPATFKLPEFFIKFRSRPQTSFLVLIGLVLILASIFSVLFYLHKASLVVYFQGKKIEKELNIVGSFKVSSQKSELLIKKISEIVEEEDSLNTTGKKTIGEKARGEVTIYNSGLAEKEFKKDTALTASNGIKFFLDVDVKVASASQSLTSDGNLLTVTGKTKAKVTADEIGPLGNIDKNEKLKIDDFALNLFFALPNASFSGGNKQELQTVSKEDMKKLKDLLTEKIKKAGNSIVKNKLKDDQIIEKLTKTETVGENYSKELGEETKNFSLNIKSKVTFYTFNKNNMKQVILNSLSSLIDPNYVLSQDNINYSLKKAEEKDQKVVLTTDISAKTIVKIDKKQLMNELMGKSLNELEKRVKEKFKAKGYEVKIKTNLPFLKSRLPFFEKNIDLVIKSL